MRVRDTHMTGFWFQSHAYDGNPALSRAYSGNPAPGETWATASAPCGKSFSRGPESPGPARERTTMGEKNGGAARATTKTRTAEKNGRPVRVFGYARVSSRDQNLARRGGRAQRWRWHRRAQPVLRQGERQRTSCAPSYQKLVHRMRPGGRARGQEHRPAGAQLRGHHRGVAPPH